MYAAAVQAAGCSAAEIVHVGDSYEKDVVGAMASGMRTAWIPLPESPRGDDLDPAPNWVLSDLHELLPALGLT
jgi:FMN phosphatase YigB (HAD superfamily)